MALSKNVVKSEKSPPSVDSLDLNPKDKARTGALPPTTIKFQGRPYIPLDDLWKSNSYLYATPMGYDRVVMPRVPSCDIMIGAQFLYKEHYLGGADTFVDFYTQLLLTPERQLVNRFAKDFHVSCFRTDFSCLSRILIENTTIRQSTMELVSSEEIQSMFTWSEIDWDVIPDFSDVENEYKERMRLVKNPAQRRELDDWKARVDQHHTKNPPGILRPPDSWNGRIM